MAIHPLEPHTPSLILDEVGSRGDPFLALRTLLQIVIRKINGFLSLGDGVSGQQAGNLHAQWMRYTAPGVKDTSFGVPHGLGRVPAAVLQAVGPDTGTAVSIYADTSKAWTTEMVWLKCNTASAKLLLLIV